MRCILQLLHSLKVEEAFDFIFKVFSDVLVVRVLLQAVVLSVQETVDVVLMIGG